MEVKCCPFCGGNPKITCLLKGSPFEAWYIKCMNPECDAEIKCPSKTEEEAVIRWNQRTEDKASDEVTRDILESFDQNR